VSVASPPVTTAGAGPRAGHPWSLWRRQLATVVRIDARRILRSKRSWPVFFLAAVPVVLLLLIRSEMAAQPLEHVGQVHQVFANIFQGLMLLTVIFFGALQLFMNLFRGEVVDRSLHYYFLAPVRREVLVLGKYLAGLLVGAIVFGLATAASYLLVFSRVGAFELWGATSLGYLGAYLASALLGVVGYGAMFLLLGLFFRNPVFPALVLYGWEWANFLLPPFLKRISVIHYLKSLCPVAVSEGPFALIAEPARPVAAVLGVLALSAALVTVAALAIRRVEVTYGDE
jgi:ABC-type transport system involved in multi-copper enzyme maturation permease subunit